MKTLFFLALFVPAAAREVSLTWDPVPAGQTVTIYHGTTAVGSVVNKSEITVTLPDTEVTITATTRNDFEESAHSTPLVIEARPNPPSGITRKKLNLQSSVDMQDWKTFAVFDVPNPELPTQFFRLQIDLN